jgi:hypothetical protein
LLRHRAGHTFRTGSVYSDIQPAKSFHGFIDQVAYVFFVAHIGAYEICPRTCGADFTGELLAFFVVPTGNDNVSSLLGKRESRRPSDASKSSCNQHDLGIH